MFNITYILDRSPDRRSLQTCGLFLEGKRCLQRKYEVRVHSSRPKTEPQSMQMLWWGGCERLWWKITLENVVEMTNAQAPGGKALNTARYYHASLMCR